MMMAARSGGRASTADVRSVLSWYVTKHWPRQLLRVRADAEPSAARTPFAEVRGHGRRRRGSLVSPVASRQSRSRHSSDPDRCAAATRTDADVDSRTEVVTVDVAGTIAMSEPPPGTAAMSVLVTRGHAAIGRSSGGDRRSAAIRPTAQGAADRRARRPRPGGIRGSRPRRRSPGGPLAPGGVVGRDAEADLRSPRYRVSIVVASLDRPDALRECLESLCRHRSRHEVEIVVVDNNPTSGLTALGTRAIIRTWFVSPSPDVASLTRETPGSSQRLGQILVTTDDDVQVPEGWLDLLLEPFERNDVWPSAATSSRWNYVTPRSSSSNPWVASARDSSDSRAVGRIHVRRGVHSGRGTWEPPRTRRSAPSACPIRRSG